MTSCGQGAGGPGGAGQTGSGRAPLQHGRARHRLVSEVDGLVGKWDERRLERVLANLLANATKYSPAGRDVVVTVAEEQQGGALTRCYQLPTRGWAFRRRICRTFSSASIEPKRWPALFRGRASGWLACSTGGGPRRADRGAQPAGTGCNLYAVSADRSDWEGDARRSRALQAALPGE